MKNSRINDSTQERLALGAAGFLRTRIGSAYVYGCLKQPDYVNERMNQFSTTANPYDLDGACRFIHFSAKQNEHIRQIIQQTNVEARHK